MLRFYIALKIHLIDENVIKCKVAYAPIFISNTFTCFYVLRAFYIFIEFCKYYISVTE